MFPKSLYAIFILALLAKLLASFVFLGGEAPQTFEYEVIANNLLSGKGFVFMFGKTPYKALIQPLPPLFTALVYRLTNHNQIVMLAMQCIMSSGLCFIIYSIARRLTGIKEALLAGALVAFHPGLVVYSVLKLHALTFYLFFYLLGLSLLLSFMKKPGIKNALFYGISIGLAVLSRATILAFTAFTILYIKFKLKLKYIALILLCAVILCLPWVIRNYIVFDEFVFLPTAQGEALWVGNNKMASGSELLPSGKVVHDTKSPEMFKDLSKLDEIGQVRYYKRRVFEFIRENPLLFIQLCAKKFYYFWWFAPQTGLWYPRLWFSIYRVYYGIVLFFFVMGSFIASKDKSKKHILIMLFAYMFSFAFLHAISIVSMRHRWTVEPIMMIFSSIGFFSLWDFLKKGRIWIRKK